MPQVREEVLTKTILWATCQSCGKEFKVKKKGETEFCQRSQKCKNAREKWIGTLLKKLQGGTIREVKITSQTSRFFKTVETHYFLAHIIVEAMGKKWKLAPCEGRDANVDALIFTEVLPKKEEDATNTTE